MRARFVVLLAATLAACSAWRPREPELALIYNPSAQHHGPDRNPIITIPGILGSKLLDRPTGTLAWGAFEPMAADPSEPEGARTIALPVAEAASLAELRDEVEPNGVLDRVRIRLLGVPLEIQAYAGILATLGAGGYRDESLGLAGAVSYGEEHFTCFQFDYDWRRDNVENAGRLHRFLEEKRAYVRQQYAKRFGIDKADVKFDIAAHSMGGLVARYFLMYGSQDLPQDGSLPELTWEGADYIGRLILIGTPNAGAVDAFLQLVQGKKIGPLLPYYAPALLGTFPSVYELLPRSRHGRIVWDGDLARPVEDLFDPALWVRMGWGLADPMQAKLLTILMPDVGDAARRRQIALDLQARVLRRAHVFHAALDRPAPAPEKVEMFLVAGDAAPTVAHASVRSADGTVTVLDRAPGDGTVLRDSALFDERVAGTWSPQLATPIDFERVMFLPEEHLGLTNSTTFRDNVLFWLLEEPRRP